jgi:transcriptional regulator with XRE-family HTH domain
MTDALATRPRPGSAVAENGHGGGRNARLRSLGAEIRAIRRRQGLSTVALAREIGMSTSLVSQIERGVTAPSLEVLWAIARAFRVPIGAFFQEDDGENGPQAPGATQSSKAVVVRANARKRLALPNSVSYELLSPDLRRQIEFTWAEFEPGDESPSEPYTHAGEEQMVVIEGEIHFWVDGEEFVLQEGDAITIDSSLPHRAANRGTRRAVVIAAMTPPSF